MSSPLPKPEKRAPRPRKRLARPTKPIARKARPRKLSKRPAAVARRKADREWAQDVREYAGGWCQWCLWAEGRREEGTDAHHVVSRRYKATRHTPINGVWLSRICHNRAHRHPVEFRAWFRRTFPHSWQVIQAQAGAAK